MSKHLQFRQRGTFPRAPLRVQREHASDPVLVVEDDAGTREGLELLLEQHGFDVVTASNGNDALRQLRSGLHPGLILLDLRMPEKNGWQFRVEQVLDPGLATIPIVAYSGDPEAHADGFRLGAVACLRKPFEVQELIDIVRTHCTPHAA